MARRSAFTLIELLVVISIVAVLAGMLLPAINAVRDAARQASCISQQRQVMLAVTAYIGENEGWLPPAGATLASPYPYTRWYSYLLASGLMEDGFTAEPLHRYAIRMRFPNPITCPVQLPRAPSGQAWQTYTVRWYTGVPGQPNEGMTIDEGNTTIGKLNPRMPYLVDGGDRDATTRGATARSYWFNNGPPNQFVAVLRNHRDKAVVSYPDGRAAARGASGLDEDYVINHMAP